MAQQAWNPTHFDGQSLTASPFDTDKTPWFMNETNSPISTGEVRPVEAEVVGLGDRDVRAQPRGTNWNLHCKLEDTNQATVNSFLRIFRPSRGQVYLRADDGDGANWRVAARVVNVQRVYLDYWIVNLRVADPVWEENSATTTTRANLSANDSFSVTNAGNERARPTKLEVQADSVKTVDPSADFGYHRYGFVVNRAPFPLVKTPVHMLDNNGADATLDTATLCRDTGTSGTLNGAVDASQTTMTLNAGHGFSDGPQFFFIDAEGGNSHEQIFGTLSTNTISSITRGVGGTTAGAHGDTAPVNKSKMLADGKDLRVFINNREVERFVEPFDKGSATPGDASTRVWCNLTMPERIKLTLVSDMTAGSPADGGEIEFEEGVADLPESGILAVERELISYSARDVKNKKVTGIERNVWFSSGAAAHTTSDPVYGNVYLTALAYGKLTPGPEPGETSKEGEITQANAPIRRPCFNLARSSNRAWNYRSAVLDAESFYDSTHPTRPAAFLPDEQVPPDDRNNADLLAVTSVGSGLLQFKDADPVSGELQASRFTQFFPMGIEAVASGIAYDVTRDRETRLRILGRDIRGVREFELADHWDIDGGSATGQTIQPDDTLHELTLQGIRAAVTGSGQTAETGSDDTTGGDVLSQKFVLDQETAITAIGLFSRRTTSDPFSGFLDIDDDAPDGSPVNIYRQSISETDIDDTTLAWNAVIPTDPIVLAAGTYYLRLRLQSGTPEIEWGSSPTHTQNNRAYVNTTAQQGISFMFRIFHDKGGPIQSEANRFATNGTADFTAFGADFTLQLNDESGDPYIPLVDIRASDETDSYHCIGVYENTTNNDKITIDAWMRTGWFLRIDPDARTVKIVDNNWSRDLAQAITPDDVDDWFGLDPGSNTITYTEADMQDTDLELVHRGKKAA